MEVDNNKYVSLTHLPADIWNSHINPQLPPEFFGKLRLTNRHWKNRTSYYQICQTAPNHIKFDKLAEAAYALLLKQNWTFCQHTAALELPRLYSKMVVDPTLGVATLSESGIAAVFAHNGSFSIWDAFTAKNQQIQITDKNATVRLLASTVYDKKSCFLLQVAKNHLQVWTVTPNSSYCLWSIKSKAERAALIAEDKSLYLFCSHPSTRHPTKIVCLEPAKKKPLIKKYQVPISTVVDEVELVFDKYAALISKSKGIEFVNLKDNVESLPSLDWTNHSNNHIRLIAAWKNNGYWACYSTDQDLYFDHLDTSSPTINTWMGICTVHGPVIQAKVIKCSKISKLFWITLEDTGFCLRSFDMTSTRSFPRRFNRYELPVKKNCSIGPLVELHLGVRNFLCMLVDKPNYTNLLNIDHSQKLGLFFIDPESESLMHDEMHHIFDRYSHFPYQIHNFLSVQKQTSGALMVILRNQGLDRYWYLSIPFSELYFSKKT